jgi:hypothetical protein
MCIIHTYRAEEETTQGAFQKMKQKGVCHTKALPFTLKSILRQKEEKELWKIQIFHNAKT